MSSSPFDPRPFGSGLYGSGIYPGDSSIAVGDQASSFFFDPRVYRSDINRSLLEDLTPARGIRATFSMNSDYDTKRQGTLEVWEPDALEPLNDWIVAEAQIIQNDELVGIYPLGHYLVMDPDITGDDNGRRGVLQLRDMSWLLRQSAVPVEYEVPAGTDHGAAVRSIAIEQGIPARLVDIPDSGTQLPKPFVATSGDDWLSVMTEIGSGGALYQPWVRNDMQLVTSRVIDIQDASPNASYRMGEGAKIVPPYTHRPETSSARNRVTVRKATPGEETVSWTATVTNENSPVHPDVLGAKMGLNRPVYLSRTYDESTLEDEAAARTLAEYRLSVAASFIDRLNIETYLDHTSLEEHQIIDIDLVDGNRHYATGKWLQRTSSVTVDGPRITCQRELTRVISVR